MHLMYMYIRIRSTYTYAHHVAQRRTVLQKIKQNLTRVKESPLLMR